ncbi:hypothetical protein CEW46_26960 [Bacillus cereus]|nr:hypothetical protein CEW46_26960 [Bacillus cereus]
MGLFKQELYYVCQATGIIYSATITKRHWLFSSQNEYQLIPAYVPEEKPFQELQVLRLSESELKDHVDLEPVHASPGVLKRMLDKEYLTQTAWRFKHNTKDVAKSGINFVKDPYRPRTERFYSAEERSSIRHHNNVQIQNRRDKDSTNHNNDDILPLVLASEIISEDEECYNHMRRQEAEEPQGPSTLSEAMEKVGQVSEDESNRIISFDHNPSTTIFGNTYGSRFDDRTYTPSSSHHNNTNNNNDSYNDDSNKWTPDPAPSYTPDPPSYDPGPSSSGGDGGSFSFD